MSKRGFHIGNKNASSGSYTWSQVSASGLPSTRDGAFGFSVGSNHYICCGWTIGNTRYKDFYKSSNIFGTSWSAQSDLSCTPRHTVASFITPSAAYFVNSDVYAITIEFSYQKDSYKFNGTSWAQQAADAGAGERSLMGSAYHGGIFYLIGGQQRYDYSIQHYEQCLKSTNELVSFSNLGTHPFEGGNLWGTLVSFGGKLWKIGGGRYADSSLSLRTYPIEIYSSSDGVTWTNEGNFPGDGRQYHQTIVFDGKIWIIGGYNNFVNGNMRDVWNSVDGTTWVHQATPPWQSRHAQTCWVADGALWMFGGSKGTVAEGASSNGGDPCNELWKMTINY